MLKPQAAFDEPHHRLNLRPSMLNRTIFKLAAPAIFECLMFSLVFFTDTLIVGWLQDETYLAGVALASLLMFWSSAPIQGMSIATTSIISRTWGEKDFSEARRYAGHALALTLIITAGILLIGESFASDLIRLLRAAPEVVPSATKYLRIVLLSSVLGVPLMVSNAVIRAKGDTTTPMAITFSMNVINIVASIILAFGIGPFPAMELYGVALGTVIARNVGGFASLAVLATKKRGINIRPTHLLRLSWKRIRRIWHVAYPAMTERVVNSTSYAFFMSMVAGLGTTLLAGHQIALNVESLAFMPAFGMSVAVTTILGQAVGSGRYRIGEITVKRTIIFTVVFMFFLGILFVFFAPQAVKVFRATPDVLQITGVALRIGALEFPFFALTFILMGALRGAGDTRSPMFINMSCIILLRLPLTYLFAFVFHWGIVGVWLACATDWAGRAIGLAIVFQKGNWKLIHKNEKQKFA
ncbi:MAG: MATE family efflux transporter [Planctomycetota bacterium]